MYLKKLRKDFECNHSYNPEAKMKILEDNYEMLIAADRKRKDNRTGK